MSDDREALTAIGAAAERFQLAEARLHETVLRARNTGHTWQQIGEVLGISRQAAFKRFGRPTDPETGAPLATGPLIDAADIAEKVFTWIAAGEYDRVREQMTHACARQLTKVRVMETWKDVIARVGALEGFTGHQARTADGDTLDGEPSPGPLVARVVLRHEAGEMAGHVSLNRQARVDGLLIAPVELEADLPF